MTTRQQVLSVLDYGTWDHLPLAHCGFWPQTLEKWSGERRFGRAVLASDDPQQAVARLLGFEVNWWRTYKPATGPEPIFERRVLEVLPDGTRRVMNWCGVVVLENDAAAGIPTEVDRTFKGRKEWEEHYRWRYAMTPEKVACTPVTVDGVTRAYAQGGLEMLQQGTATQAPVGLFCGSLIGHIRDFVGVENLAYLAVDDEALLDEMIETVAQNAYQGVRMVLEAGARFDYGHFWEDICYRSGPLVSPALFAQKIGPWYRRITELLRKYGITRVSVDCDGCIDALIPTWLANGVNVMNPVEVGTWGASIGPWRAEYGRSIRAIGGVDKKVFAQDRAAVDREIQRLRPLVELGGYLPCPDHQISPDAQWDLVAYYCERMREAFG